MALGTFDGTIWLWNLADKNKDDNRLVGDLGKGTGEEREQNVVWLTHFLDEDTLVTAAADGRVLQWDPTRDRSAPKELFHLGNDSRRWYRIVISPDGHWLAAGLSGPAVEIRSFPDGKKVKRITLDAGGFPAVWPSTPPAPGWRWAPTAFPPNRSSISRMGLSAYTITARRVTPSLLGTHCSLATR